MPQVTSLLLLNVTPVEFLQLSILLPDLVQPFAEHKIQDVLAKGSFDCTRILAASSPGGSPVRVSLPHPATDIFVKI